MNGLHASCTRAALAALLAALSGCASQSPVPMTAAIENVVSFPAEVAIVTGRAVTTAVGIAPRVAPPPPELIPAPPPYLR